MIPNHTPSFKDFMKHMYILIIVAFCFCVWCAGAAWSARQVADAVASKKLEAAEKPEPKRDWTLDWNDKTDAKVRVLYDNASGLQYIVVTNGNGVAITPRLGVANK